MNTQHPWLTSATLSIVLMLAAPYGACIKLERQNPDTSDIGIDAALPDIGTGDGTSPDAAPDGSPDAAPDVTADTGLPDVTSDAPGDAVGGCDTPCPEANGPCSSWQCNETTGQCEEVNSPNGTACGGPCSLSFCQEGACQPALTTEPVPAGSCSGPGTCASTVCGTFECNLDTCMCELAEGSDDQNCCQEGACDAVDVPPGCFGAGSCNELTNICMPEESFDPAQCACELPEHCGPAPDACTTFDCSPGIGCVAQVQSGCTPCTFGEDDALCDNAAKQQGGPCSNGFCSPGGTCVFEVAADCETCDDVNDCSEASLCNPAECVDEVCLYEPIENCFECEQATNCPELPAGSCDFWACTAGVCDLQQLPNCNPSGCTKDSDCDDGDPCTSDTCALASGTCSSSSIPGCSPLGCNGADIDSPSALLNLPPGAPGKVAGEPVLGNDIVGMQVTTCGDQDTTLYSASIAIDDQGEVIDTQNSDASFWVCQEQCNSLFCGEPHASARYWVWGSMDEDGVLAVAGWCLAMDVASLVGKYEVELVDLQGTIVLMDEGNFGSAAGGLVITTLNQELTVDSVALSTLDGTLTLTVSTPFGESTVVLTGEGNTLSGQLLVPGQDAYTLVFTRQP